MSWGAQSRSEDAKTPNEAEVWSDKPEPDRCPVQPYPVPVLGVLDQVLIGPCPGVRDAPPLGHADEEEGAI
jgi:hypothetical protein